jgi:large subunit ribosomal protein L10
MPITKAKKGEILKDLDQIIDKSKSLVFVSFKGIDANDTVVMRKKLTSEKVGLKVAKKTLIKKVLADKSFTGTLPDLGQETAFGYMMPAGEDLLAPAREVFNFTKEHKGLFHIMGGIFDGAYKTKEEMMSIATIPSRDVLLSQIAYLLKSPMQRLAIAVNEVSKKK